MEREPTGGACLLPVVPGTAVQQDVWYSWYINFLAVIVDVLDVPLSTHVVFKGVLVHQVHQKN
jgi:hypothetical protein